MKDKLADCFVCHYISARKTLLWFGALHWLVKWKKSARFSQAGTFQSQQAGCHSTSVWAQYLISSISRVLNRKWMQRPPVHKDSLVLFLDFSSTRTAGFWSEPAKNVPFFFFVCACLSNFNNALTFRTCNWPENEDRQVMRITRYI